MESLPYRKAARVVSIIQLVLLTIGLILTIYMGFLTIALTLRVTLAFASQSGSLDSNMPLKNGTYTTTHQTISQESYTQAQFILGMGMLTMWLVFTWLVVTVGVEYVAVVKLFKATALGADRETALRQCRFWRTVIVIFSVIGLVIHLISQQWINAISLVLVQGLCLYIVTRYMDELDSEQQTRRAAERKV